MRMIVLVTAFLVGLIAPGFAQQAEIEHHRSAVILAGTKSARLKAQRHP